MADTHDETERHRALASLWLRLAAAIGILAAVLLAFYALTGAH